MNNWWLAAWVLWLSTQRMRAVRLCRKTETSNGRESGVQRNSASTKRVGRTRTSGEVQRKSTSICVVILARVGQEGGKQEREKN